MRDANTGVLGGREYSHEVPQREDRALRWVFTGGGLSTKDDHHQLTTEELRLAASPRREPPRSFTRSNSEDSGRPRLVDASP